ncbi:MAG: HisA/HisF-related TIM barrel protein [Gemmatimonadales bacterium]
MPNDCSTPAPTRSASTAQRCDRPALLTELADRFGVTVHRPRHRCRTGHRGWRVFRRSGSEATGRDAVARAIEGTASGAGEILLTSIDRDGTRSNYDLDLLRAVSDAVTVPVIASGGARTADDFVAADGAWADAVLAASMFHDGDTTVTAVKQRLAEAGVEVRP